MYHDEVFDQLAAYALGGLDPEEEATVEAHMRECAICEREYASYLPLRDALNENVVDAPLPAGAGARMQQRVAPVRPRALPEPKRRRSTREFWPELLAACLIAGLALGAGLIWNDNRNLNDRIETLSQTSSAQQATISDVVDLMERADLEVKDLPPAESGAQTRVYEAREGDVGMIVFDHLPALPEGQVYQLWVSVGGELQSVGTFTPTSRGSYHKLLKPPAGFAAYEIVGVAPSPAGGLTDPPSSWTVYGDV